MPKLKRIQVSLSKDTYTAVQKYAKQKGLSISSVVAILTELGLVFKMDVVTFKGSCKQALKYLEKL